VIHFLIHGEYAQLLGATPKHFQPMVAVLFTTGLRFGEVTALQVGDVSADYRTVTVNRAWKNGDILGEPKSAKSYRTVALADEVLAMLLPLISGRRADVWLFTLPVSGGPVRSSASYKQAWLPAIEASGDRKAAPCPRRPPHLCELAAARPSADKRCAAPDGLELAAVSLTRPQVGSAAKMVWNVLQRPQRLWCRVTSWLKI